MIIKEVPAEGNIFKRRKESYSMERCRNNDCPE